MSCFLTCSVSFFVFCFLYRCVGLIIIFFLFFIFLMNEKLSKVSFPFCHGVSLGPWSGATQTSRLHWEWSTAGMHSMVGQNQMSHQPQKRFGKSIISTVWWWIARQFHLMVTTIMEERGFVLAREMRPPPPTFPLQLLPFSTTTMPGEEKAYPIEPHFETSPITSCACGKWHEILWSCKVCDRINENVKQ